MPQFSRSSRSKLATCHQDLQAIFTYVIDTYDCIVIRGYRSPERQYELYMKGREVTDDGEVAITDKDEIVTYKDGIHKLSKHNHHPSFAVDVAPYFPDHPHIRWDDSDAMRILAGRVMGTADVLRRYGLIDHHIRWGGNWDRDMDLHDQTFMDLVHFEII